MARITQKSSVATFPLWFLRKQNRYNMDIVGISIIAFWCFYLRWGTWNKSRKITFSIKLDSYLSFFSEPCKSFNVKTLSKYLLDIGKNSLLLTYTYYSFSSTVGLLLHVQYYQRCEPMILKGWVKSKFVLCQPRYYNLLNEKKNKKIHVFELIMSLKTYRYCQSQEIFVKHHLSMIQFVEIPHCQIQLFWWKSYWGEIIVLKYIWLTILLVILETKISL